MSVEDRDDYGGSSGAVTPWVSADLDAEVMRREAAARVAGPDHDGCRKWAAIFPASLALLMGVNVVAIAMGTFLGGQWGPGLFGMATGTAIGVAAPLWSRYWWRGKNPFLRSAD